MIIDTQEKRFQIKGQSFRCRIGRGGAVDETLGAEGDEKTPRGDYTLRFGLYRSDRLPAPPSPLIFRALREDDGWCDAPDDAAYNRFVRLPYPASHEKLWRQDGAYDIILVMSHNDNPPVPGAGSAVFIHIAHADDRQTLGCVAIAPDDMVAILPFIYTGLPIKIR